MTEIHVAWSNPKVCHVSEFHDSGLRYRWTRVRWTKPDGDFHFHDMFEEVADEGPLLFIPEGPDVDEVAVHDLVQMAKQKKRKPRDKPDVTKMYQQFNERRAAELADRRIYAVAKAEP